MSATYFLVNSQNCTFDKGTFASDAEAVRWAAGRGGSYNLICWGRGIRGERLVASWRNGRRYHSPHEGFVGGSARPAPQMTVPDGYRAPKRHYVQTRQDVIDGTIGLGSGYMMDGATRSDMRGYETEYEQVTGRINRAENAGEVVSATINVERKNTSNGYQYRANVSVFSIDGNGELRGRTIGGDWTRGSGYDKKSTAVADTLNRSDDLLRMLIQAQEDGIDLGAGVSVGYGSYLPEFNQMIGMNAIVSSLEALGFSVEEVDKGRGGETIYHLRRVTPLPSRSSRPSRTARPRTASKVSKPRVSAKAKSASKAPAKRTAPKAVSKASKPKTAKPRSKGVRR